MVRQELLRGFQGCLGYDYHKDTKSISVNEKEAEIVRYIFNRYIVVRQIKRGCFRQIKTVRQEASGKHPVTLLSVYLAHWKKQQATHAD